LSHTEISPIVRRMARPKKFVEEMVARFMAGTFARIAGVLRDGEDRADLVRDAVDAEIRRRENSRNRSRNLNPDSAGLPQNGVKIGSDT
jgi:hypothetical protein